MNDDYFRSIEEAHSVREVVDSSLRALKSGFSRSSAQEFKRGWLVALLAVSKPRYLAEQSERYAMLKNCVS